VLASLFSIASNYFVIAKMACPNTSVDVDFWFDEVMRQHAESQ